MERISDKARELHEKSLVVAMHTDYWFDIQGMRLRGHKRVMQRHIPRLRVGGVNAIGEHVGGDYTLHASPIPYNPNVSEMRPSFSKVAFRGIDNMMDEINENSSDLTLATKAEDLVKAKKDGKIAVILSFEGAEPLEDELCLLRTYYRLGLRAVGLSHNLRNQVVDGLAVRSASGLTDLGVQMIEEMNRLGIIVDVSHVSYQGVMDTVKYSKDPIIASHSNVYAICNHRRNLKDDQIQAIAEKGGVIGMHLVYDFITGKSSATIDDLIDHLDYIRDLVGIDHVALGPDRNPVAWNPENKEGQFYGMYYVEEREKQFPTGDARKASGYKFVENLEDVDKLPNLTDKLIKRGYSDQEIEKILGRNWLRIMERVWRN